LISLLKVALSELLKKNEFMNSVNGAIVYYNGGNVEYSENRKRGREEEYCLSGNVH
jgi:TnpA family transposase